jgi:large subunit ribosomal protein L15
VSTALRIGNLRPSKGATRPTKRRGKGAGTGLGGTAGKGHKGKKARAGGKIPAWFEGGQMPMQRRLPKRGFKNPMRVEYQVVNVGRLAAAPAGATVDRAWLEAQRLVRRPGPIKLLGNGELKTALTVRVQAVSEKARKAVEGAGGKVEIPAARSAASAADRAPRSVAAKPAKPAKSAKSAKPAAPEASPAAEPPEMER